MNEPITRERIEELLAHLDGLYPDRPEIDDLADAAFELLEGRTRFSCGHEETAIVRETYMASLCQACGTKAALRAERAEALLDRVQTNQQDAETHASLIRLLSNHCGERGQSEGAIDTLVRIIAELERAEARLREAHGPNCNCHAAPNIPHPMCSYIDPCCTALREGKDA